MLLFGIRLGCVGVIIRDCIGLCVWVLFLGIVFCCVVIIIRDCIGLCGYYQKFYCVDIIKDCIKLYCREIIMFLVSENQYSLLFRYDYFLTQERETRVNNADSDRNILIIKYYIIFIVGNLKQMYSLVS